MELKFLTKDRILASQLFGQTFKYLVEKYDQSKNLLTPASPFTMILNGVSEIGELIFFYIQRALSEMNIITAKNRNSVYGLSVLSGHNPTRAIAATGKVGIRLKPGNATNDEFSGNFFYIPNYIKLVSLNNNLPYFLVFDQDSLRIEKGNNETYFATIVQGTIASETFISKGKPSESFSINVKEITDNFWVKVYVNGEIYRTYDSIYDMNYQTKGVVVKTGINGGIDVRFGSGSFGMVPPSGSQVKIEYLKTNGAYGNIGVSNDAIFKFEGTGLTKFQEAVDLNETVYLDVIESPSLGSDAEDINFTRMMAPRASKSYVLANASNYIYFLSKYNYFSTINAYSTFNDEYLDDDNVVYLYLLPDISKKMKIDDDYFSLAESEFTLNDSEKNKVRTLINESGQQFTASEIQFVDPTVKRYSLSIVLRYFDKFEKEDIRSEIRTKLNDYFLNIRRRDKIPRSDIVAIIESIEGVDSVNVYFTSQENEKAIYDGFYIKSIYGYNTTTGLKEAVQHKQINLVSGENPNLGLDEFGDIVIGEKEIALIRGGWKDRNNKYYEETPMNDKLSSLNIVFKEKIAYDIYVESVQNKKKYLS